MLEDEALAPPAIVRLRGVLALVTRLLKRATREDCAANVSGLVFAAVRAEAGNGQAVFLTG